jgi:hypothetical protein
MWVWIPVVAVAFGVCWYWINRSIYRAELVPVGGSYCVRDRHYRLPQLPIENAFHQPLDGIHVLQESFQCQQRRLYQKVSAVLSENPEIPWFVAGGTLLGFQRHGTFLPFDDDIDIHTTWEYRDYFWGPEFASDCARHGLDVFSMRGASLHWAWAFGNSTGIRCKLQGTCTPTVDIFFEKNMENGFWSKIESWDPDGSVQPNPKETWPQDSVFPIVPTIMDHGLLVHFPADPEALLRRQYGQDVLDVIQYRGIMAGSHRFYFTVLKMVWKLHSHPSIRYA